MHRFRTTMRVLLSITLVAGIGGAGVRRPAAGTRQEVVVLKVLLVLYTHTFTKTLTAGEIARFHREVAEFQHFYRDAVGDRMRLDLHLLQIDRTLQQDEVGQVAPGRYYLSREDVAGQLTALGLADKHFDEVIAVYAWDNINRQGAVLAYGGGAVGPDGHFLGDAGFNSQGAFAWDPGRISQILIHELLHNIDDMFNRSGMPDGFYSSDDMSRNMEQMLAERPGYFLPDYDDDSMRAWAERELRGEEGYPWAAQLKYYAWTLGRTPAEAWQRLAYGSRVQASDLPQAPYEPLYREIRLPAGTREADLVAWSAADSPAGSSGRVRYSGARTVIAHLAPETTDHTGFDGRTITRTRLLAGTLEVPTPSGGRPATVQWELPSGRDAQTTLAVFAPLPEAAVSAAAPPAWEITREGTDTAQVGRPYTLFLRARERDPVTGAQIRARVGEAVYDAVPGAEAGTYAIRFPGLPPGTPQITLEGRGGPEGTPLSMDLYVPVVYRGTIVVPERVARSAGAPLRVEAWLRDRMGDRVLGVPVPLVLIAGDRAWPMAAEGTDGTYTASPVLPEGTHRLVVTSLRGTGLYRQLIWADIAPAASPARTAAPPPLTWGLAVAPRRMRPPVVDGDLTEWTGAPSLQLGGPEGVLTDPTLYAGPDDFSMACWIAWDSETLYVSGRVRDDVVTWGDQWDSDRLNLVFDMGNDTTPLTYGTPTHPEPAAESDRWTPDDYWVLTRLFTAPEGGEGRTIRVGKGTFEEITDRRFAARRTGAGYDFELALPASALPEFGAGFPGKVIGLQLFFTDGDSEATATEIMWKGRWGYDSGGIHWEMAQMGQLLFTGPPF